MEVSFGVLSIVVPELIIIVSELINVMSELINVMSELINVMSELIFLMLCCIRFHRRYNHQYAASSADSLPP